MIAFYYNIAPTELSKEEMKNIDKKTAPKEQYINKPTSTNSQAPSGRNPNKKTKQPETRSSVGAKS